MVGLAAGYLPPCRRVRLGWQEAESGPGVLTLWHNGGTGGYRSFVGFVPGSHVGAVVLSNSANDVDPIGMALLKALHEARRTPGEPGPEGETPGTRSDKLAAR